MFEKKIKKFFNSVSICGERPKKEVRIDRRLLMIAGIAAGTVCAALGASLAVYFVDKTEKPRSLKDNISKITVEK